jgi:hypothetical protein
MIAGSVKPPLFFVMLFAKEGILLIMAKPNGSIAKD